MLFEVGERRAERTSRLDDIVHPDAHGDQIRPHRQGRGHLLPEHVSHQLAAYREVGVFQTGIDRIDQSGETVGKSEESDSVITVP